MNQVIVVAKGVTGREVGQISGAIAISPPRHIADSSVENFYWLRDKIDVKFQAVTYHGGHSVKRSHAVTSHRGDGFNGFILPMLAKCKEYGILKVV